MTTTTTNAESRAVENFENFDGVPADAQQVLRVRPSLHSGETLQDIISHRIQPELNSCWNAEEKCWYLWSLPQLFSHWKSHTEAIRLAGGLLEWVRPAAVNVNPSGRAPLGWHL